MLWASKEEKTMAVVWVADALLQSTLVDLRLAGQNRVERRGETSSLFYFSLFLPTFVRVPSARRSLSLSLCLCCCCSVCYGRTHIKRWPMRLIVNSAHFELGGYDVHWRGHSHRTALFLSLVTFDPLLSHVHCCSLSRPPLLISSSTRDCFSVSHFFIIDPRPPLSSSSIKSERIEQNGNPFSASQSAAATSSISWWILSDWWVKSSLTAALYKMVVEGGGSRECKKRCNDVQLFVLYFFFSSSSLLLLFLSFAFHWMNFELSTQRE